MGAYFESGFSYREPSWHGEETLTLVRPETAAEARTLAGLDWDVDLTTVWQRTEAPAAYGPPTPDSQPVVGAPDGFQAWMVPVDGFNGVRRNDTGAILGIPRAGFQPVGNGDMFDIVEALQRVPGVTVKWETAGSVQDGRRVYALVYLDEPFQLPGDSSATLPYMAIVNNHDGSGACRVIYTDVRIVCWNTTEMALGQADRLGTAISIRHIGDVASRIESAKEAIAGLHAAAKAWHLTAEFLHGINVSDAVVKTFFEDWIPTPDHASERLIDSRRQRREEMFALYQGSTNEGITGTAYGLWNACTEYLDHIRPYRSRDTYLTRTMLGGSAATKVKAQTLDAIRHLATAGV